MEFCNETKPSYSETDASVVELGAGFQQTREGVSCLQDKACHSNILIPIALTSKSLSNAKKYVLFMVF